MNATPRSTTNSRSQSTRLGTAAVELAVVLPVGIVLTLGCVDYARAIHAQIALANAARVGADYAATNRFTEETYPQWEASVREMVQAESQSIPAFDPLELVISVDVTDPMSGTIEVTVSCTYRFRSAVSWPGMSSIVVLRQSVTTRQYQ